MEIPSQQLKGAQKSFRLNSAFISVPGNWTQVVQWVNQLRGGVQREGKLWTGVPGRMGIYRKDGQRGVHKGRDGAWKPGVASLKPGEDSMSRGRKRATVSKVAGRLNMIMRPWPIVRTGCWSGGAQKPDFVW